MKFKFSTQALLMASYYKCATLSEDNNENFKSFALDILKSILKSKTRNIQYFP